MKKSFLSLLIIFFISTSCKQERAKTPEELKMELWAEECRNPLKYLELSSVSLNKNKIKEAGFFSSAKYDGHLLTGKIKNNASIAKFKDVVISIEYFSKTNTLLQNKKYTQFEYFEPNTTKDFTIKVYPPNSTENYNVTIFTAGYEY